MDMKCTIKGTIDRPDKENKTYTKNEGGNEGKKTERRAEEVYADE
jgi:hypothetical protein